MQVEHNRLQARPSLEMRTMLSNRRPQGNNARQLMIVVLPGDSSSTDVLEADILMMMMMI